MEIYLQGEISFQLGSSVREELRVMSASHGSHQELKIFHRLS
jgi:hypothetical protein